MCSNANAAIIAQLLDAKASVNAAVWNGETPLMIAAGAGSVEAVKLLLAGGAEVNRAESRKGQTALMWAVAQKHADVVKVLLENGTRMASNKSWRRKKACSERT